MTCPTHHTVTRGGESRFIQDTDRPELYISAYILINRRQTGKIVGKYKLDGVQLDLICWPQALI